jgi:DNA-entry nuclease
MAPSRRRSGSAPSLAAVLIVAVLILGFYLLRDDLGDIAGSLPPDNQTGGGKASPATRDAPGGRLGGDNTDAIRKLGGKVDYGRVDPKTGQRSGITATIVPAMVRAAADDRIGTPADQDIRPPGWNDLPTRNRSRGHLLGRQLGGTGDLEANLVTLYQRRANSPVMRDYETAIADAVEKGETVRYRVKPGYASTTDKGAPVLVRLTATGDRGFKFDVAIANTANAEVTEFVALEGAA